MPRYELDGKLFWNVSRSGTAVTVTSGKLGNKGRTTVRHHPSTAAAQVHHDDLVIAKAREGYKLVETVPPEPIQVDRTADERADALEARIVDDPEDSEAWMVYGDLLQRRGDPRGELVALQIAAEAERAANPRARGAAQVAVGRYFATHAPALLGSLAKHVKDVRDPAVAPFLWRSGFIHRAELAALGDPGAIVDELLQHPSGRLLVELAFKADDRAEAVEVLDAIARMAPPALRELDLFARADLADLGNVWAKIPRLRRLYLTARSFELGDLRLPDVQRARFFALALSPRCMDSIATAPWPVLERLELRLGNRYNTESAAFEHVRPLLERADMPALTHLKIRGAPFAGAILRTLAQSPLARQLLVLDLSHGTITPQDGKTAASSSRFTQLRELWIPFAGLWAEGAKALEGITKHLINDKRGPLDTLEHDLGVDDSDPEHYDDVDE